ncbi:hypothetical protein JOF56_006924 [Kibdelosporangium banguiense]|uniref:LysM domain-containing protein n=1 Tax=Kibdelosporangium banguiense TaxID=1365924 RepID=A0ABS4TQ57_9PSEU|nr:hypothetical protein [Kibdelosporangium banguiense]MBP2326539.1 hypothetical protein [Kibdelosporangium banguiense]
MFARISRYQALEDVATTGADGRRLSAKALRVAATATGRYQHTITEGDRLDGLAAHYYRQPRNWWRICDANPEILSPQELLGAEPVVTYRFEVTAASPQWPNLLRALTGMVGVTQAVLDGAATVQVTFNRLNVTVPALAAAMQAQGFTAVAAKQSGRTGKQIVIPPDVLG